MKKHLLFLLSLFFMACGENKGVDLPLHLKDLKIIAHRGVTSYASENTMRAISSTIDLRLDAVEFDIQMSKDSVLVVFHDDDLFQRTGKRGAVMQYTLQELKQLRLINKYGVVTTDEIPTVREIIPLVKGKIHCFIDLKYGSLAIERELVNLLQEFEMQSDVVILSFDNDVLVRLSLLDDSLPLCLLLYDEDSFPMDDKVYSHLDAIGLHYSLCKKSIMKNLKKNLGVAHIYAYTVNSLNDITEENLMDIDGVITDNPLEWFSFRANNP